MKSQYLALNKIYIFFILCLIIFSNTVLAWNKLTDTVDIHCYQDYDKLNCDYRELDLEQPLSISVSHNETTFPKINKVIHTDQTLTTAILFLVDTSDPARQNVVEQNKAHIKKLLESTNHNDQFGLAVFDKTMRIKSPIGTSMSSLNTSLTNLNAEGYTTELYRSLLKAIDYLATVDVQQKLILLFSDGQAEDKAYFHADVVKAARKSKIIINSIGYPRSLALSVALQTLRRISEETGGIYKETNINYYLPQHDIRQIFTNIKKSYSISFDLTNNQSEIIELTLKSAIDSQVFSIPVNIKTTNNPTKTEPSRPQSLTKTTVSPSETLATPQTTATQSPNILLWYGLPITLVTVAIALLIILFLIWRQNIKAVSAHAKNDDKPYAYLITENDPNRTRYPIKKLIWRIGRSDNNELKIDDTSVSRQHAEIHKNHDGTFDIIDNNSKNGIYIGNKKIKKSILNEGDIIDIGDIVLRFTQFPEDHTIEEETVMQKTKTPI